MENSLSKIAASVSHYKTTFDIPFIPTLSTAWDASPRTLPQDAWGNFGCACNRPLLCAAVFAQSSVCTIDFVSTSILNTSWACLSLTLLSGLDDFCLFIVLLPSSDPWGLSWHSNLTQWKTALQRSKTDMEGRCAAGLSRERVETQQDAGVDEAGDWCPPLISAILFDCFAKAAVRCSSAGVLTMPSIVHEI